MTGDGRIVVARARQRARRPLPRLPELLRHARLRAAAAIELEPVRPYVRLRHIPFEDAGAYFAAVAEVAATRSWEGEPVDFMDGTVFAPGAHFLTLATMVDEAPPTSDYTGEQIYYRSIPRRARGPPHDPRLPVALGHRLVLVLAVVRGAAPADPPAVAEALAAQRRLLEDRRLRAPPPDHAPGSTACAASPATRT